MVGLVAMTPGYFGLCPECPPTPRDFPHANVGAGHWFYCAEHRIKWFGGSNLFSAWRDETELEQREAYDRIGLARFRIVSQ